MTLNTMSTVRETTRKVSKDSIYRSVASSSAIESTQSVQAIEQQLKSNKNSYKNLKLAN